MKSGGGSSEISRNHSTVFLQSAASKITYDSSVAEAIFFTLIFHILPYNYPLDLSNLQSNLQYIKLMEDLNFWDCFSAQKKSILFEKSVLINCSKLVELFKLLDEEKIKSYALKTKLLDDFFEVMELLDYFNPITVKVKSSLSLELKTLMNSTLHELQSKIPERIFNSKIKSHLLAASSSKIYNAGLKEEIARNSKKLYKKEFAEIIYNFFYKKPTIDFKQKLEISLNNEISSMLIIDFYKILADIDSYNSFALCAFNIYQIKLLKERFKVVHFKEDVSQGGGEKIVDLTNIILITDHLCFFQKNYGENENYKQSVIKINEARKDLITLKKQYEANTVFNQDTYALQRAYFRLSEFYLEQNDIETTLKCSILALKYCDQAPLLYNQLFSNLHLIKSITQYKDKESYIDKVLKYIKEKPLAEEIKTFVLFGMNPVMYVKGEKSDIIFSKYTKYAEELQTKYPHNAYLNKFINKIFLHDKIWFFCFTKRHLKLKEALQDKSYKLHTEEKIYILCITNNVDVKLLIDTIDAMPNKLDVLCYAAKIYIDLFENTQHLEYLTNAKKYLAQTNALFKTSYLKVTNEVQELVYRSNLTLLFELLTIKSDYQEYLDLLIWLQTNNLFVDKKIDFYIEIITEYIKKIELEKQAAVEPAKAEAKVDEDDFDSGAQTTASDSEEAEEPQQESYEEINSFEHFQSPADLLEKLKHAAYQKLKRCAKHNANEHSGINIPHEKIDNPWFYRGNTYSKSAVKHIDGNLYGLITYQNDKHKSQIDKCKKVLDDKGLSTRMQSADGVKWVDQQHYEIKVVKNKDFRLVAKVILKNSAGEKLLMFDTAMNHKEINKKWHVESIDPQALAACGSDSPYAAPPASFDYSPTEYQKEEADSSSIFDADN